MTHLRRRRHQRRRHSYVGARTTNRVPRVLSTNGQASMPAGNYKIYSGHGDTGLPDGTAGTHPGYMATGGYQYNLVQAREASRSPDYIDSSYLGTPLAPASRSPGQLRAPGHQGIPVASLESRIWDYSTTVPGSSLVVIQVLHDLARSRWRVRVYLRLEIRF